MSDPGTMANKNHHISFCIYIHTLTLITINYFNRVIFRFFFFFCRYNVAASSSSCLCLLEFSFWFCPKFRWRVEKKKTGFLFLVVLSVITLPRQLLRDFLLVFLRSVLDTCYVLICFMFWKSWSEKNISFWHGKLLNTLKTKKKKCFLAVKGFKLFLRI